MRSGQGNLVVDAGGVEYCDASGIALFMKLRLNQKKQGGGFKIEGLSPELQKLYDLFDPKQLAAHEAEKPPHEDPVTLLGIESFSFWEEIRVHIEFTGRVTMALSAR